MVTAILRKTGTVCALLGILLLSINVYGMFQTLRSPNVSTDLKVPLSYSQISSEINKNKNETDEQYLYRLNNLIYAGISHHWTDSEIDTYNLRVPVWENYILYLASYVKPSVYEKYEFFDYNKALERGVGLCSQKSMVMTGILNNNGIEAGIIDLIGHVVLQAKINNKWYIADPDYNVVLPYDLKDIEENPALIDPYYTNGKSEIPSDVNNSNTSVDKTMTYIYSSAPNKVYPLGVAGYSWKKYYIEKISYILKWLLPVLLFLPLLISLYRSKKMRCIKFLRRSNMY